MKLWINKSQGYTPLMQEAGGRIKLADLSYRMVVENMGANMGGFTPVKYMDKIGWVDSHYVEDYPETLPIGSVYLDDVATKDQYDAKQYVDYGGVKQVNFCGELCVCFLLGLPLSDFLETWKIKSPSLFTRIFGAGRARGTGAGELVEMLETFGQSARQLSDKVDGYYSPHRLAGLKDKAIVSVNIDGQTGRLRGSGILHWIVIIDVWESGAGDGTVDLYNPFNNKIERYSYAEFLASARSPYGAVML